MKPTVEDRAKELVKKVTKDIDHESVFWVPSNSNPDKYYRVQVVTEGDMEFVTCTCLYGLHRPGSGQAKCSHALAVMYHRASDASV